MGLGFAALKRAVFLWEFLKDGDALDWRTADGIDERTLMEVRLFDVSIVTYPAYPETSANVRSCAEVFAEHREAAPAGSPARIRLMRMKLDLKEKEMDTHGQCLRV